MSTAGKKEIRSVYSMPNPEAWWALLPSSSLAPGKVEGVDALGLQLAVYRGETGEPNVVSRHCPHMGASLASSAGGVVRGNRLVCPFHAWEFGTSGRCVRIPGLSDEKIPKRAVLERYPAVERGGFVWMYSGDAPAYPLPEQCGQPDPDYANFLLEQELSVHPLVLLENNADPEHFRTVHRVDVREQRIEILTNETHHLKFRIDHGVGDKDGRISDQSTTIDFIGPNLVHGLLESEGHEVARFQIFPLPLNNEHTIHRTLFRVRKLEGWRSLLNLFYTRRIGRLMARSAQLDFAIFDGIDPAERQCVTTLDSLQMRYQRYYTAHITPRA